MYESYYDEVELATKEEMKDEAIRRMKMMGYFKPSIDLFAEEGAIMLNEPPLYAHYLLDEFNSPEAYEELKPVIDKLQADDEHLVYAVILSFSNIGKTYSILSVEQNKEEWNYFDEDIHDGITFAYVYNSSYPDCSEFGSIGVALSPAAGLKRTHR